MKTQPSLFRPAVLLSLEAFCGLVASCMAYHLLYGHHWGLFACLFLVPDISLLPYLRGPGRGVSIFYNAFHTYALPILLGIFAVWQQSALAGQVSLIWMAHISMDRAIGFGLKYPSSFKWTHLQSAAEMPPQII